MCRGTHPHTDHGSSKHGTRRVSVFRHAHSSTSESACALACQTATHTRLCVRERARACRTRACAQLHALETKTHFKARVKVRAVLLTNANAYKSSTQWKKNKWRQSLATPNNACAWGGKSRKIDQNSQIKAENADVQRGVWRVSPSSEIAASAATASAPFCANERARAWTRV
eukprot:5774814-Pleurochrysis_carterae.AAC.2